MFRNLGTIASVFLFTLSGCAANQRTDQLSSAQLAEILVGNTEIGRYQHKGYDVTFSQFYTDNGKIMGCTSYGPTTGRYEILKGGCFYTDFFDDSGVADGCNYYTRTGENQFRVSGPFDSSTDVTIHTGNQLPE